MQIVSTVEEVRKQVKKWREEGLSVLSLIHISEPTRP